MSEDSLQDAIDTRQKNLLDIEERKHYFSESVHSQPVDPAGSRPDMKMFYSEHGNKQQARRSANLQPWSTSNIVRKKNKASSEFAGLQSIQEVPVFPGPSHTIWVLKFSPNGEFLAVAGALPCILLYPVSSQVMQGSQILLQEAIRYQAHSQEVIDISWAKSSNFFLSASADCTALLWKTDENVPKMQFAHPKCVTCVSFHPTDANFIMTGCVDRMVRIWYVPQSKISCSVKAPDYIISGEFRPSGDKLVVGLSHGQCMVYDLDLVQEKLIFVTVIACRNKRGLLRGGRDVTGIQFIDNSLFLVTTNDSRLRLISLSDFNCKQKYKGTSNSTNPIRGTFSHDSKHVICGSDSGAVFIWNTFSEVQKKGIKNKSFEFFQLLKEKKNTIAVFIPANVLVKIQNRYLRANSDIIVTHAIVAATGGKITVFYNQFRSNRW